MTCSYCSEEVSRKEATICRCGAIYCSFCASGLGEELQEEEEFIGEIVACPRCHGSHRRG